MPCSRGLIGKGAPPLAGVKVADREQLSLQLGPTILVMPLLSRSLREQLQRRQCSQCTNLDTSLKRRTRLAHYNRDC